MVKMRLDALCGHFKVVVGIRDGDDIHGTGLEERIGTHDSCQFHGIVGVDDKREASGDEDVRFLENRAIYHGSQGAGVGIGAF